MYLDRGNILSYNASLNFIVLKRGFGKSWTFKDMAISDFLKDGSQTMWVRRYKTELFGEDGTANKFFDDIRDKYPNVKLEVKGHTGYINGKKAILFVPLSTAQSKKSVPYPRVKNLIFDEFIIENNTLHYLADECSAFAGLLSSVFRDRPIRAFLLGNKVKQVTPYNIYFNLPDFNTNKYIPDRKILIYSLDGDGQVEKNYAKSDLEKILKGTAYYDYSMKNTALSDNSAFIEKRPKSLQTAFIIKVNSVDVGIFFSSEDSKVYCDIHCDKSINRKYCYDRNDLSKSYFLFSKTMPLAKMLRDMYKNGRLFFNDTRTKTIMQEVLDFIT